MQAAVTAEGLTPYMIEYLGLECDVYEVCNLIDANNEMQWIQSALVCVKKYTKKEHSVYLTIICAAGS